MFRIDPFPEFSWSMSRQRLFDQCPRAYYCRYYLSHNGWLPDAPHVARQAWRLGKLQSLDTLLGQEVDRRGRELEAQARAGHPPATVGELEERTKASLRAAWRSSRDQAAFEASPKSVTMLRTFYVDGRPPSTAEVERVMTKLAAALARLVDTAHWERLASCGPGGCVAIPDFACFRLGELKVFAAADLAYVHDDTLHVVDWKTGRPGDDEDLQVLLSVHALTQADWLLEGLAVEAVLEYLTAGATRPVEVPASPPEREAVVREVVAAGVAAMRAYLRDPGQNAPLEAEAFERRESGLCPGCNFRPLCEAG